MYPTFKVLVVYNLICSCKQRLEWICYSEYMSSSMMKPSLTQLYNDSFMGFFLKIYSSISTHLWCFSQFLSFWKDFSCPTQISNWLSCHFKTDIKCFYIDVWLFVILSYTFNIFKPLILISLAYKIMETIQKQYIIWT